jgi:cyclopropane fatty-acyl-phospholipid synthase-like methyltransferase/branched-subunit amino acid aminotransferase/4-amino-4-deoxychorismate lyase
MLALTCERARLEDGMEVLDLGCGWGSLSLFVAGRFPACRVTAMSNSRTQVEHIAARCARDGIASVTSLTADVASFAPGKRFDRIISVEMLEHVRDYRRLFALLRGWLEPDGKVFVHVFSHERSAYTYNADDPGDWMGRRFFSGGQMPAYDLFALFDEDLATVDRWWVGGEHYARTLEAWLRRYDEHSAEIWPLLEATYGRAAAEWRVDWRLFFLACAETFAYGEGKVWGVAHHLLAPVPCGAPCPASVDGDDGAALAWTANGAQGAKGDGGQGMATTGSSNGVGQADVTAPPRQLASVDGVLCDAREAMVPMYDDGLLRGDGAFEFVRCYAGKPFTLVEHLDRMGRTCATLRLPYPRAQLEAEIAALLAWAGPVFTDLRIVLTRGGRRLVIFEPYLDWPPAHLALVKDTPRGILSGAKSLSYAGNMLARRIAEERGFWEALLTWPDGRIMEVQQAAFFWVTPQGELCTPPLSEGPLDSITRRIVMKHLDVSERVCRTEDALTATEAFLAGTAREVQAVGVIEGRVFDDPPGPFTLQAIAAYRREVEERLGMTAQELWAG